MILYRESGYSRTALLAIANCMLLKGSLVISPVESDDGTRIFTLKLLIERLTRIYSGRYRTSFGKSDVIKLKRDQMKDSVKFLSDLFDVEIGFTRNEHIQSSTGRLHIFEHLKVQLLHAWMVEPNDAAILVALGAEYHPVFKVQDAVPVPENADPLLKNFLNAGVTAFGIKELLNNTVEGEVFTLFRKRSFYTLTKHKGTLYLLNNAIGASEKDMWKVFNERDDGQICNSNFVVMGENISEDTQQAQAEVPSQTIPSLSGRIHKCQRPKCQADFLSEVNLNRHIQAHSRNPQLIMASFSKADLRKLWDELNREEAGKVLSIKDMNIEGVSGDRLCKVIENVDDGNEFCNKANRMKAVLNGTKPISSDELFTLLDECSENTAFSTNILSCPEKCIFSLQSLLLCDLYNVFACCSYFVEKNMVSTWLVHRTAETTRHAEELLQHSNKSLLCGIHRCTMKFTSEINLNRHRLSHAQTEELDFMANIGSIAKYWDDLTCDQIRQILSLKGTKITGFNLRNLKRRLEDFKQDHPLSATAQKLIDILKSSKKMTLTEMLDVLGKASEDTHFSNDIRSCKDDEICAVGDNKCAPANNVALMSYIIEIKLVEHWESVKNDTQQQLVPDPESKKRILLDEFTRSNKLTKIYKIRPKDIFRVLKRSLKKLKKDFASKIPKKKLKAVFKLSCVLLTHWGRKCARGFLLWIVKNHREGRSWSGSFQLSDMQVINGQFIISKEADMKLTLESASADFKSLWELLLVPFYTNSELGRRPLYFDEFGHDMFNLPDPVADPDGFMKHEKYLALHFAFMPPLSRVTLLINLYKAYDSNRLVHDHAYVPLNRSMNYDWRDNVKNVPILTKVYYYVNDNNQWTSYTSSYYSLLKFSWHYGSHDLDHTKVPGVEQMVSDMMITDLVLGQLLAASLSELVLFIVNHTNMDGRFFQAFQQFESSDDNVFFCIEDDLADDSPDTERLRF